MASVDTAPDARGSKGHPPGRASGATKTPSVRPAMVVMGIAAALLVLFGIGGALTGSSPPPKSPSPDHVNGTALGAAAAAHALAPIEILGTPPADVLDALVVPEGAARVASTPWDGLTQYSGDAVFSLHSTQAAVVGFYRAELRARGWSISSVGAARGTKGATEVLAQRASSDGWYWDVGVVVSPTTFASQATSPATSDSTRFTVELYEVPDPQ